MKYLGPKTDGDDLATQSDLSGGGGASTPAGVIVPFAGSSAPTGYLVCDGAAVSRTTYADLFAAIGTTYGAGDGSTTFALPNLKGRVVVGVDAGQSEFDTLGETGGAKTHTLDSTEIPAHTHSEGTLATDFESSHSHSVGTYAALNASLTLTHATLNNIVNTGNTTGVVRNLVKTYDDAEITGTSGLAGGHSHDVSGSTGSTGGGGSHNNLSPYMALSYLIKT